jgi:putative FmdB family regulatory protein
MPIYEYRCESCGKELEKIQKFSDPPLKDCPKCGKSSLKKLVSASSFRLKGTGWYETDFKTKKKPDTSDDKGESKSDSKDKDSQSGSTETKGSASRDGQKEKPSTSTESSKKSNSGDKDNK